MDATTVAAWAGVIGAIANALALVIVERRKFRPDATLTATYEPGQERDAYGNAETPGVRFMFNTGSDTTIKAAGLAPTGRLWRWRRVPLPGYSRTHMQMMSSPIPAPALAGQRLSIWLPRSAAVEHGLDPTHSYVGWVQTGNAKLIRSARGFTLEPEMHVDS